MTKCVAELFVSSRILDGADRLQEGVRQYEKWLRTSNTKDLQLADDKQRDVYNAGPGKGPNRFSPAH